MSVKLLKSKKMYIYLLAVGEGDVAVIIVKKVTTTLHTNCHINQNKKNEGALNHHSITKSQLNFRVINRSI